MKDPIVLLYLPCKVLPFGSCNSGVAEFNFCGTLCGCLCIGEHDILVASASLSHLDGHGCANSGGLGVIDLLQINVYVSGFIPCKEAVHVSNSACNLLLGQSSLTFKGVLRVAGIGWVACLHLM